MERMHFVCLDPTIGIMVHHIRDRLTFNSTQQPLEKTRKSRVESSHLHLAPGEITRDFSVLELLVGLQPNVHFNDNEEMKKRRRRKKQDENIIVCPIT